MDLNDLNMLADQLGQKGGTIAMAYMLGLADGHLEQLNEEYEELMKSDSKNSEMENRILSEINEFREDRDDFENILYGLSYEAWEAIELFNCITGFYIK